MPAPFTKLNITKLNIHNQIQTEQRFLNLILPMIAMDQTKDREQ